MITNIPFHGFAAFVGCIGFSAIVFAAESCPDGSYIRDVIPGRMTQQEISRKFGPPSEKSAADSKGPEFIPSEANYRDPRIGVTILPSADAGEGGGAVGA